MERCIQLANIGRPLSAPNPSVGCVIVRNNSIIGEGYTSPYGGLHAEVNALNSLTDQSFLHGASLYVTLEPCCHHGKTPPCTDAIINNNIKHVIIGCLDPNPKVSGQGVEQLKEAGVEVTVGICASECQKVHRQFLTFQSKKRPYITLKWAESADGYMAPLVKKSNRPYWISNIYSQQLSHKLRTENEAILVGANTVFNDNPQLTARFWYGKNPKRFVLSQSGNQSLLSTFDDKASAELIGSNQIDFSQPVTPQLCDYLVKKNISSLIVEGGRQILNSFITENNWDEALVFINDRALNTGLSSPKITSVKPEKKAILNDCLHHYLNNK